MNPVNSGIMSISLIDGSIENISSPDKLKIALCSLESKPPAHYFHHRYEYNT